MDFDFLSKMTRTVYLARHGEAVEDRADPRQPLSDKGREEIERVAVWAVSAGISVAEIRHSGILRAEQSAAIFAEHLHPSTPPSKREGLEPGDDVREIRKWLLSEERPQLVVAHMPLLGKLVGLLVAGDPVKTVVEFPTAGFVGLSFRGEWTVSLCIDPSRVRR